MAHLTVAQQKRADQATGVRYYDLRRNWRTVQPHLGDAELNRILVLDFGQFFALNPKYELKPGMFPGDMDFSDWRLLYRKKPHPAYMRYCYKGACHWVVNFALRLATLTRPERDWRILTTQAHSTVWDGSRWLFDLNFQAAGLSAEKCFKLANGRMLAPRHYMMVGVPD